MAPLDHNHIEDIAECIAAGRAPRATGPYRVQIGDVGLNFQPVRIEEPTPTGRQIMDAAAVRKLDEHMVFQVLHNGELEELRPDETVDLRTAGVERFIIFEGAASYRINLDGRIVEWGAPAITGRVLKRLAGVDATRYGVWLENRNGGQDRSIGDDEIVRVDEVGLERFFTGVTQTTEGAA
ncbi:multiubiquitin domain-containing protein [Paracoccus sp. WLY502]|uniref:multiubiquitin domain-containing protein n=1 Tax=Paracoccus yibinensis TaxID=3068891 RepID=UPI0027968F8C|nr:multiubiquitin domain-containing protein [Paracoccus sp. WLY502]MDQ1902356.1 multiubiquitin domain-containing protein [Paracoccus sp. WLY502]